MTDTQEAKPLSADDLIVILRALEAPDGPLRKTFLDAAEATITTLQTQLREAAAREAVLVNVAQKIIAESDDTHVVNGMLKYAIKDISSAARALLDEVETTRESAEWWKNEARAALGERLYAEAELRELKK